MKSVKLEYDKNTTYVNIFLTGNLFQDSYVLNYTLKDLKITKNMVPDIDEMDSKVFYQCKECGKKISFKHIGVLSYHAHKGKQTILMSWDSDITKLIDLKGYCPNCFKLKKE